VVADDEEPVGDGLSGVYFRSVGPQDGEDVLQDVFREVGPANHLIDISIYCRAVTVVQLFEGGMTSGNEVDHDLLLVRDHSVKVKYTRQG